MPMIRSSADLRNGYNEISTHCHEYGEPVFITKNGKGDLVVMSIESYERLVGRFKLYKSLKEGMDDVESEDVRSFSDVIANLKNKNSSEEQISNVLP